MDVFAQLDFYISINATRRVSFTYQWCLQPASKGELLWNIASLTESLTNGMEYSLFCYAGLKQICSWQQLLRIKNKSCFSVMGWTVCSKHMLNIYIWPCVCVCVLVTQSCPTLCNPQERSLPGFSVHVILQARILERIAIFFSRGSSWPRYQTLVSWITGRFCTIWAIRKYYIWPSLGIESLQMMKSRWDHENGSQSSMIVSL